YLDLGFYLGINGIIYKRDLKEVIKKTSLDRILLETDCPYLGKEERNEPIFVRQIAKDIARIKNISFEQVAQATTQNAQKLFGI
ncbi:MAG: TatD family hydrolase, partial [bacterium]|nr:TatD family hydrolase [bacterium]